MHRILSVPFLYQVYSEKKIIGTKMIHCDLSSSPQAREVSRIFPVCSCLKVNSVELWNILDDFSKIALLNEDVTAYLKTTETKFIEFIKKHITENPNDLHVSPNEYRSFFPYRDFHIYIYVDPYDKENDPKNTDFIIMCN